MAKGGKREGAGRKAGVPNKITADIRAVAMELTPAATRRLEQLLESDSEAVALGAVREVYDRAFGKASQVIAGDPDKPVTFQQIARRIVDAHDRDGSRI